MLSGFIFHWLYELIGLSLTLLGQGLGTIWILRGPGAHWKPARRRLVWVAALVSFAIVTLGFALRAHRLAKYFPAWWWNWGRGLMIGWGLLSVLLLIAFAVAKMVRAAVLRAQPKHSAARRNFLLAAQAALIGAPVAAIGYGAFVERLQFRMREESIEVPGLDPALHGLRLVQLTDIHMSPFLSARDLDRVIAMANETRAHVALVTGDLITTAEDPLDQCLDRLAGLRADAGIFGCMGNHEVYAGVEDYVARRGAQVGIRFLRRAAVPLKFGNAVLNLAGVDYQRMHTHYLRGAEALVRPGAFNVLLSHNPDVFPSAARKGFQFTISGHTHGGQIRVEILHQDLNLVRFITPYVDGIYRKGPSSIFVSRGIGTIGLPLRLGAPPEVALLTLCRT